MEDEMGEYERPATLATYSVDELVEEAVLCIAAYEPGTGTVTVSDGELKEQIEEIEDALEDVSSIRTS
jgi:hypothetical protein